ncbi:MAG: methyltransferase domain-containing protein [Phycisphaerales bacterium]|nr:MAG: methyltransferase domain-containing protein [Phycisphaerales bacterium]
MLDKPLKRLLRPRWLYMLSHSTRPISPLVGTDRGTPIDRRYIEQFLERYKSDIKGRVLEIKDPDYTRQFGGQNVTHSDVLDIATSNTLANIHDDIKTMHSIADETYDCFICTQTLQYIDDLDGAIRNMKRVLKPGGVMLVTLPTLGKIDGQEENIPGHYWRLTPDLARLVFERHFPADHIRIESWGNLRLAFAFLAGLTVEDMSTRELETHDPLFTCGVFIRARR